MNYDIKMHVQLTRVYTLDVLMEERTSQRLKIFSSYIYDFVNILNN